MQTLLQSWLSLFILQAYNRMWTLSPSSALMLRVSRIASRVHWMQLGEHDVVIVCYFFFAHALQVPTSGLLNIIGAPHLAVDSTYVATYTPTPLAASATPADTSAAAEAAATLTDPDEALEALQQAATPHSVSTSPVVLPDSQVMVEGVIKTLTDAGFGLPAINPTGYWSSGWPRLDGEPKLTGGGCTAKCSAVWWASALHVCCHCPLVL